MCIIECLSETAIELDESKFMYPIIFCVKKSLDSMHYNSIIIILHHSTCNTICNIFNNSTNLQYLILYTQASLVD